eukprot:193151_1
MGNHNSQLKHIQPSGTPTTIETTSSIPSIISGQSYKSRSTPPVTPILNYNYSSSEAQLNNVCINNGITGIYVSENIAKIVVDFWRQNIDLLSMQDQLEIGCSIFFGMNAIDKHVKKIFKSKLNNDKLKIEYLSLKFLNHFAYLTRNLLRTDLNLYLSLSALSVTHKRMGIKMKQFHSMLTSMHETFSYYFPKQYTTQVKCAVDNVFTVAAKIITDEYLNKIRIKHHSDNTFLDSLDVCLSSPVGKAYLFSYLQERSRAEIVKFLQLLSKLELQTTDKGKYIVARHIVKQCILPNGVNYTMSNANIQQILECMQQLEKSFLMKEDFKYENTLFVNVEHDVYKSIQCLYWSDFVLHVQQCMMKKIVMNSI